MAFQLREYGKLLSLLAEKGYALDRVSGYFLNREENTVYLRHDVDRIVPRAVDMARLEADYNVSSTYYFRCTEEGKFPVACIELIQELGHEVGFHYETLAFANGNQERALELFQVQLARLRCYAEVQTVVAHGSPLSRFSNAKSLARYDLAEFGLLGEAGIHIDFSKVLYVTDSGGRFGSKYNLRDWSGGMNFEGNACPSGLATNLTPENHSNVVINTHPERWPKSGPGLLQASFADLAANSLKVTVRAFRGDASK